MPPPRGHACFQCREHKVVRVFSILCAGQHSLGVHSFRPLLSFWKPPTCVTPLFSPIPGAMNMRTSTQRCNGSRPICSRCERLSRQCIYASDISRRALITGSLEARALELELSVHKATLASAHNLSLASMRLLERVKRLGTSQERRPTDTRWLPIYPQPPHNSSDLLSPKRTGQVLGDDVTEGYSSVVSRDSVESQLTVHQWSGLDDLPSSISDHLIHLFLPYRSHYYFFMDLPYFLHCFSLPPSHPESIHPCLLNACYLAACESSGGVLASLQPFFIQRTRYFLNQSLMYGDRIMHFLWATVVLACNLGRRRRLGEAYVIVSSAALLVSASGRIGGEHLPNIDDTWCDSCNIPL
ncbi:hypothetical protein DL93DRAFT_1684647 [Clavulina sp. PMI_390]|nr:hypothetical protein DL93DRAFT_1684647 [Clavulina sp. PMI_390]